MRGSFGRRSIALMGLLAAASGTPPARAAPPLPASPVSAEPSTTSASYGDWVVRCQRGGDDRPARVCEAAQTVQAQGQGQPVAQLAIGRPAVGQPLQVTVVLPASVSFPSAVRVLADDKDAAGIEVPWLRCLPGACVAGAVLRDDVLKRWRGAPAAGRIAYRNAGGQEVAVAMSFRGLAQALDALAKEPG